MYVSIAHVHDASKGERERARERTRRNIICNCYQDEGAKESTLRRHKMITETTTLSTPSLIGNKVIQPTHLVSCIIYFSH